MSRTHTSSWRWQREGLLSAVSAGMFLLLIGVIILATPRLVENIVFYFGHFTLIPQKFVGLNFSLPAPETPADLRNLAVYRATMQFCVAWGVFQIVMLALRYWFGSPVGKKGEAISNIVFWLGTGYIIQTMLNTSALTSDRWFQFWAILIVVSGVSLVVRALYLAVMWPLSRRHLYTAPSATP